MERNPDIIFQVGLWGAWCKTCKKMIFHGVLFRAIGWPYCPVCKTTTQEDPRWPGTAFEWVPPMEDDGILRVWDTYKL